MTEKEVKTQKNGSKHVILSDNQLTFCQFVIFIQTKSIQQVKKTQLLASFKISFAVHF